MTKVLSVATANILAGQLADIHHRQFPRVDYLELQKRIDAETIDYSAYENRYTGKLFRNLETQLRSDIFLATLGWRKSHQYPLVFAWSERAGIPIAGYKRFLRSKFRFVSMFQCWSARQEAAITRLGLFSAMDQIIVHCSSMHENLIRLGAPPEKVKTIHYSIDQAFFSPVPEAEQQKGMIMSIGEPRSRDYASLFQAVKNLPVSLRVPAYGHWYAREKGNGLPAAPPENVVLIKHLTQLALRNLYASAQFVVLPIHDLVYSAGATSTLEAGSMARAIIAFRSRGITDYIIDGETGILVEPGNIAAMRDAIQFLSANPAEAKRLGENARQRIVETLNLETYVQKITDLLLQTSESSVSAGVQRSGWPSTE